MQEADSINTNYANGKWIQIKGELKPWSGPLQIRLITSITIGALTGVEKLWRLSLKLGREPSTLAHVAPPRELIVPPFEGSVKPVAAHSPRQLYHPYFE
jgi:hypothetical protein